MLITNTKNKNKNTNSLIPKYLGDVWCTMLCGALILCHTNGHTLFGINVDMSPSFPCLVYTEYCHDHERGVFHHHIEMAHINKLKFTK